MLSIVRAGVGSPLTKEGARTYNKLARALRAIVNAVPFEKQNPNLNRRVVAKTLVKMGALLKRN
jgi:hypothetical protein